jgi:hypothetical protein
MIENSWGKYVVMAKMIEADQDKRTKQLQAFLVELSYE